MAQRIFKTLLKYCTLVIIVGIVFYNIGVKTIITTLSMINLWYLPLLLLTMVFMTLAFPLSLLALYSPLQSKKMPMKKFYKIRLMTQILGNLTPNKIGELYLFLLLRKKYATKSIDVFYLFVMDKMTTIILAAGFSAIGFLIVFNDLTMARVSIWLLLGVISGSFAIAVALKKIKDFSQKTLHINGVKRFFVETSEFIATYLRQNYRCLMLNCAVTFGLTLVVTLFGVLAFLALGSPVPVYKYFFVVNILTIMAIIIPLNLAGIGVKEIGMIYLMNTIGINPRVSTSVVIVATVMKYASYALIYLAIKHDRKSVF